MRRLLPLLLLPLLLGAGTTSVIPNGTVLGNSSGSTAAPSALTDVGPIAATPTGAPTPITLAKIASQQGVLVDAFKIAGDADDTASFTRAIAANVPILLGPKTYSISAVNVTSGTTTFVMKGVKGATIIQRNAGGSTFFALNAANVYIEGVTFDCNSGSISANNWCVLANAGGQNIDIAHSSFKNNSGSLGSCLSLQSTGPAAGGWFLLDDVEVTGCTFDPLYLASVSNGSVVNSYIHDNSTSGAYVTSNSTATSTNYAANIALTGNLFARNTSYGLIVGGCAGATCTVTPYPATGILISNNRFLDNTSYQLAIQADHVAAIGNRMAQSATSVAAFGGIDCNATYPVIVANEINLANASYGIDCGGAIGADIKDNSITLTKGDAIDVGGAVDAAVRGNTVRLSGADGYAVGVQIFAVEGGGGGYFPGVASNINVSDNTFVLTASNVDGVAIYDNAGGYGTALPTRIKNNTFHVSGGGTSSQQDIRYFTAGTALFIEGNQHNGTSTNFIDPNGSGDVITDNVFDEVRSFSSTANVRSIITNYINTYNAGGSILYVNPTAGGSNYTAATTLAVGTCVGGSGWTGTAQIVNGAIIGVRSATNGSSYGAGCTVSATDSGGGSGATFNVGQAARLPGYKRLRWVSNGNTLQNGGGAISITGMNTYLPTNVNQSVDLEALNAGTFWALISPTNTLKAPTVSSGFGSSPSITGNFGPSSFSINVGTGGAASSGVIGLPAAAHGWACTAADVTTPTGDLTQQTDSSTTSATFTNYVRTTGIAGPWTASDILQASCWPN